MKYKEWIPTSRVPRLSRDMHTTVLHNSALPPFSEETSVNSISISGILTPNQLAGQKMKPRWPPMEGNFVR